MVLNTSCGIFSSDSNELLENGNNEKFEGDVSSKCVDSLKCKEVCKKLFSEQSSLLDKCRNQESGDVSKLKTAVTGMEKGSWAAIKTEYLYILTNFDKNIWPKYAGVVYVKSREMLLWVAKNKEIADLLDEEHEVLRRAFKILGAPAHADIVVFDGMKKDVDVEKAQSFFEVSALAEEGAGNDKAFKAAHELLKSECGENKKSCVKSLYCAVDQDKVFAKVNELELAEDTGVTGHRLHRGNCD